MSEGEMISCYSATNVLPWQIDQMKITLREIIKLLTVVTFWSNTREAQILHVIPVVSTVVERYFSCMRWMENCFRHSMLTNLLGNLAIKAVHSHTILFKNRYMQYLYGHLPSRMMAFSLFIGSLFIRYWHILIR